MADDSNEEAKPRHARGVRPNDSQLTDGAVSAGFDFEVPPSPFIAFNEGDMPPIIPEAEKESGKITLQVNASDYPRLRLSGRIISASFCLPHNLTYTHREEHPWTLNHRSGTSALFDSFKFISSRRSTWKHLHIAWTGEIVQRRAREGMTVTDHALEKFPPKSRLSAPYPVDGGPLNAQLDPNLHLSRIDRNRVEQALWNSPGIKMVPVWLYNSISDDGDIMTFRDQTKWRHFTEREIFRLFHYMDVTPTDGNTRTERWNDYYTLNKMFAQRILEFYTPGDLVMLHDYHLLLLPAMLRERVDDMKIQLCLHTPFPSHEYFRCLGRRDDVLEGILGADMLSFQTVTYADHFRSCVQHVFPRSKTSLGGIELGDRHIDIQILPIGIDIETLNETAFTNEVVDQKVVKIRKAFQTGDRKVIVGRDRLDQTRGVLQKLHCFAWLLVRFPIWRGKVFMVQVTAEATLEDKERGAEQYLRDIEKLVRQINGRFGTVGYVPVRHYNYYLSKEEYYTFLRAADVGLMTSIRDGTSTTSLEFVATQKDNHSPLILSEFSGTSAALNGCISINPWDFSETAKKINDALLITPKKRAEMYDAITPLLNNNCMQKWVEKSLRRLCVHLDETNAKEERSKLDRKLLIKHLAEAGRRLFVFDYDGTLTPIIDDPNAALPSAALVQHLAALASNDKNTVWVASGRDQDFLTKWLGSIPGLGLSAEHGSFIRYPWTSKWVNLTVNENMDWQPEVIEMMRAATREVPGSVLERKRVAITWHYRRANVARGMEESINLTHKIQSRLGADYNIEVMTGKANIEVRPKLINKGQIVKKLINDFGTGPENEPDFVLCLGDDTTDEDMFRALRRSELPMENVFGAVVGVGTKARTMASWRVDSPGDVVELLGRIVASDRAPAVTSDEKTMGT